MTTLIVDGTWTGLLSSIYDVYARKLTSVSVITEKRFLPDAFSEPISVVSDESRARRVWNALGKLISQKAMDQLYSCYLSELAGIENYICSYIRMAFDMKESPEHAYAVPFVLKISQVDRMVHREKHRMEAFTRFQLIKDGLYYASIEPDFNVLPLIAAHFKRRYADQHWLIYDLRRNYGIYYNLEIVSEVKLTNTTEDVAPDQVFDDDEMLYQRLWSDYFKHVNIKERKNSKLHLQHVPRRYWKYLTEKLH